MDLIHTCYRVTDPERSIAFHEALGLEKRREVPIRDEAVNYFLGVRADVSDANAVSRRTKPSAAPPD